MNAISLRFLGLIAILTLVVGCDRFRSNSQTSVESRVSDAYQEQVTQIIKTETERYAFQPKGGHDLVLFLMNVEEQKLFDPGDGPRSYPLIDPIEERDITAACFAAWEKQHGQPLSKALAPFSEIATMILHDINSGVDDYEARALAALGDYLEIEKAELEKRRDLKIQSLIASIKK